MTTVIAVDLPPSVALVEESGGLSALRVSTPLAEGEVYLHGAHVASWVPAGHDPVIWMSKASRYGPADPIRGGVPICFPWFGPGREPGMSPAHGFARLAEWRLVGATDHDSVVTLTFQLGPDDVTGSAGADKWPHGFEATYTVVMSGELRLSLSVRNTGSEELSYEEALHTYLHVQDITAVTVVGLDGADYLDKAAGESPEVKTQQGPVTFTGETDRVYHSDKPARVVDPARARTITVSKESSADTVVWNPWTAKAAAMPDYDDAEWPTMVCVETANVLDNAVVLAPGASHTMSVTYAVSHS